MPTNPPTRRGTSTDRRPRFGTGCARREATRNVRAESEANREKRGSAGASGNRAVSQANTDLTNIEDVLSATVTGTGGALLGSALTTAAGFGVLALALAPPLQRFGIVTGLAIVFAFLACILVLPSLLVVRERLLRRMA